MLGFAVAFAAVGALAAETERPSPLKGAAEFQSEDLRKLAKDDFANPGMGWVTKGEARWKAECASCHKSVDEMKGVAAKYPKHDAKLGRVVNVEERINACVVKKAGAKPYEYESEALLALTAYVGRQSAGVPIDVDVSGPAAAVLDRGQKLYTERQGQLNLACDQCHDGAWGRTLYAEKISQGHPADWPAYRMEWQALGSLQRRLRACYFGVRAEMPPFGSPDLIALELYLADRAKGLATTIPGVRK